MAARRSSCDPREPVACATRRRLGRGTIHPEGVARAGRVSAWWCRAGRRGRFAARRLERATIAACFGTAAVAPTVRDCKRVGAGWSAVVVSDGGARSTVFCFGAGDLTGAGSGAATPPGARSGPGALTPPVVDPAAVAGAAVAKHASSATTAAQLVNARSGDIAALTMAPEAAPSRHGVADLPRASAVE
jgi:hypothetical protein